MPNTTQDNVYIVNLSTINGLAPISTVIDNFAKLHYDYAKSWLHFEWYSKLWVLLNYWKMTATISDYKLGKIDTNEFISKLQEIFYFLPAAESVDLLKNTWNSLILWDAQSTQRLNYLIDKDKDQTINLISNTNELNIQKIKQDINSATQRNWNWQEQTLRENHFQIFENFRLMTSYENKIFKTAGLLENLVTQLDAEEHNRKNITLVSQYEGDLVKAKALGINSQKPDQFFPPKALASSATPIAIMTPRHPSLPSNLLNLSQSVAKTSSLENESNLERKPLLKR